MVGGVGYYMYASYQDPSCVSPYAIESTGATVTRIDSKPPVEMYVATLKDAKSIVIEIAKDGCVVGAKDMTVKDIVGFLRQERS